MSLFCSSSRSILDAKLSAISTTYDRATISMVFSCWIRPTHPGEEQKGEGIDASSSEEDQRRCLLIQLTPPVQQCRI